MKKDIPPDAQAAIEAFKADETARATERAQGAERTLKKHRILLERLQSGTVFTSDELARYANDEGWKEIRGGGHRKFQLGKRVITLPRDGGQQKTIQQDTAHRFFSDILPDLF